MDKNGMDMLFSSRFSLPLHLTLTWPKPATGVSTPASRTTLPKSVLEKLQKKRNLENCYYITSSKALQPTSGGLQRNRF